MLFIPADANATWLTVRDVIAVDGKSVPRRLPGILAARDVRMRDLRALSAENGKYNIGAIARNFNEPTLALLFLDSRYRSRFEFSDGGSALLDGQPVRRIQFSETATPTVIRSEQRDVRATGALLVEPATGRVLRTELTLLRGPAAHTWPDLGVVRHGRQARPDGAARDAGVVRVRGVFLVAAGGRDQLHRKVFGLQAL
jgi:hypothetical protein